MSEESIRAEMGRRVKEARLYLSLSQEELSTMVGVSRSAISKMEDGSRGIEALELTRIAKSLGRTTEYFTSVEAGQSKDEKIKFLARALGGLSEDDLGEVERFAAYLKSRSASK